MAAAAERYAEILTVARTMIALCERVVLVSDWGLDVVTGVRHHRETTSYILLIRPVYRVQLQFKSKCLQPETTSGTVA